MQDPQSLKALLGMLGGDNAEGVKALESRARRGQMTFAATQYAVKSGCGCDACRFLVKAVDEELAEARKEAGIDAPSDDPLPREVAAVSRPESAGDGGGRDLPERAPAAADRPAP